MQRTYVQVNGVRLGVEQRGVRARFIAPQGGDEGPTTLVLLHGFTGSAAAWGHQLDTLADYGLRIIALDLLGQGQSDAPDDPQRYTIERCHANSGASATKRWLLASRAKVYQHS